MRTCENPAPSDEFAAWQRTEQRWVPAAWIAWISPAALLEWNAFFRGVCFGFLIRIVANRSNPVPVPDPSVRPAAVLEFHFISLLVVENVLR